MRSMQIVAIEGEDLGKIAEEAQDEVNSIIRTNINWRCETEQSLTAVPIQEGLTWYALVITVKIGVSS